MLFDRLKNTTTRRSTVAKDFLRSILNKKNNNCTETHSDDEGNNMSSCFLMQIKFIALQNSVFIRFTWIVRDSPKKLIGMGNILPNSTNEGYV